MNQKLRRHNTVRTLKPILVGFMLCFCALTLIKSEVVLVLAEAIHFFEKPGTVIGHTSKTEQIALHESIEHDNATKSEGNRFSSLTDVFNTTSPFSQSTSNNELPLKKIIKYAPQLYNDLHGEVHFRENHNYFLIYKRNKLSKGYIFIYKEPPRHIAFKLSS